MSFHWNQRCTWTWTDGRPWTARKTNKASAGRLAPKVGVPCISYLNVSGYVAIIFYAFWSWCCVVMVEVLRHFRFWWGADPGTWTYMDCRSINEASVGRLLSKNWCISYSNLSDYAAIIFNTFWLLCYAALMEVLRHSWIWWGADSSSLRYLHGL